MPSPGRRAPPRGGLLLDGRGGVGVTEAFRAGRASTDTVDETADGDAPHPRRHLAPAVVARGAAPDRDEGVLECAVGEIPVGAASREAEAEPGGVPVVEQPQRPGVARRHGGEQLLVGRCLGVHTPPVVVGGPNGSSDVSVGPSLSRSGAPGGCRHGPTRAGREPPSAPGAPSRRPRSPTTCRGSAATPRTAAAPIMRVPHDTGATCWSVSKTLGVGCCPSALLREGVSTREEHPGRESPDRSWGTACGTCGSG